MIDQQVPEAVRVVIAEEVRPIRDILFGTAESRDGGLVADVRYLLRSFRVISRLTLAIVTSGVLGLGSLVWKNTIAVEANGLKSETLLKHIETMKGKEIRHEEDHQ